MNLDKDEHKIPDLILEQFRLNELSREDMDEIRRQLERDPESRARLSALEDSDREILEKYPADVMARKIDSRIESRRVRPVKKVSVSRPLKWSMGLAAAFLLMLLFLPKSSTPPDYGERFSVERIKGEGPKLRLYLKTVGGSVALSNGAVAFEGDVIRIGYQAAGQVYGAILSVDGRGKVTQHLPAQGNHSAELKEGGTVLLDFAIELDDAPRWERFFLVTRDTPFELEPVLRAAQELDIELAADESELLALPSDLEQHSFSLEKGVRK